MCKYLTTINQYDIVRKISYIWDFPIFCACTDTETREKCKNCKKKKKIKNKQTNKKQKQNNNKKKKHKRYLKQISTKVIKFARIYIRHHMTFREYYQCNNKITIEVN